MKTTSQGKLLTTNPSIYAGTTAWEILLYLQNHTYATYRVLCKDLNLEYRLAMITMRKLSRNKLVDSILQVALDVDATHNQKLVYFITREGLELIKRIR